MVPLAETFDITVIGGGAAGLSVAAGAAQLGLKVALVEREQRLGGDCLHHGCVPSKTLIHSARVAHLMRRAGEFGLEPCEPRVDLGKVMGRVQAVIDSVERHDSVERFQGLGVKVLIGRPWFRSARELEVEGVTLQSRKFVIATGSRAAVPPIPGLREAGFLTNVEAFQLKDLPGRLAVIGGGPIGLEFAQTFQRLGSKVIVLEGLDCILGRREDLEVSCLLTDILKQEGLDVRLGVKVVGAGRGPEGKYLAIQGNGGEQRVEADEILVATGRSPNVEGMNLEAAGVEYDKKGIQVDGHLRTTTRNIWACGDVIGSYQFTHVAGYHAGIVIRNAVFHLWSKVDHRVVPWTTFTDPELARVGLTEAEARDRHGDDIRIYRQPFGDVDRAEAEGETKGLLKLVCTPSGEILGVHLLGPNAGDLLPEFVLAMKSGLGLKAISDAIHVYPTLAQVNRQAVNQHFAAKLFSPLVRRVAHFLVRW